MKTIKTITKGKYTLRHERYLDSFGFERDAFVIFNEDEKCNYPFLPTPKANNYNPEDEMKFTSDYTEKEYNEMLKNEKI